MGGAPSSIILTIQHNDPTQHDHTLGPRVTRASEWAQAGLPPGGVPAPPSPPALPGADLSTNVPAHRSLPTDIPPPGNIPPLADAGEFLPVTGPTATLLAQARTAPPEPAPSANQFLTLADDEDEGTGTVLGL